MKVWAMATFSVVAVVGTLLTYLLTGGAGNDGGPPGPPPGTGGGDDWAIVFEDGFDGSSVRSENWRVRDDDYLPYDEAVLTARAKNVSVSNGSLKITAHRERGTVGKTTRDYTTGYLDTIGKNAWQYGRFEMRAKLPNSVGMWPAFWLRADRGGAGEIDILEGLGGMPNHAHQAILENTHGTAAQLGNDHTLPTDTTAQWHVYAVEVEPERVTWEIDGKPVFTVTSDEAPWLRDTFDEPMNIRLNLQVGGKYPDYMGKPVGAASQFPATFEVDWVRVLQRR